MRNCGALSFLKRKSLFARKITSQTQRYEKDNNARNGSLEKKQREVKTKMKNCENCGFTPLKGATKAVTHTLQQRNISGVPVSRFEFANGLSL